MPVKIYLGSNGSDELELDDDEELTVHPTSSAIGGFWNIKDRKAFRVEYWDGIIKTQQYIYYDKAPEKITKTDAMKNAEKLYKEKNKNTKESVIKITAKQITPFVMKHFRFVQPATEYDEQEVKLDPLFTGIWIGDGTSGAAEVTNIDPPIVDYLKKLAKKYDIPLISTDKAGIKYTFRSVVDGVRNDNFIKNQLRELNLLKNKHIPQIYMQNSKKVRLGVLAGLIDSDGCKDLHRIEIGQKSPVISRQIVELARSLGIFTTVSTRMLCATNTEAKTMREYYRIFLYPRNISIPCLLSRKTVDIDDTEIVHGIKISMTKSIARNVWTDEMKKIMFDCAKDDEYKKGSRVNWMKMKADHDCFNTMTADAIRAMHTKLKKQEKN